MGWNRSRGPGRLARRYFYPPSGRRVYPPSGRRVYPPCFGRTVLGKVAAMKRNANQSLYVPPMEFYGQARSTTSRPPRLSPPGIRLRRSRWRTGESDPPAIARHERAGPTIIPITIPNTKNRDGSKAFHFLPQGTLSTFCMNVPLHYYLL